MKEFSTKRAPAPRKKLVKKIVREVREKYGIGSRPFTEADFRAICKRRRIFLLEDEHYRYYAKFPGLYGCYLKFKNSRIRCIWLKSFFEEKMDLRVACHELGHHFMQHEGGVATYYRPDGESRMDANEAEADLFAELAILEERPDRLPIVA